MKLEGTVKYNEYPSVNTLPTFYFGIAVYENSVRMLSWNGKELSVFPSGALAGSGSPSILLAELLWY